MSNGESATATAGTTTATTTTESTEKIQSAIQSLSSIVPSLSSSNPLSLLHDDVNVCSHISTLLRNPNSGSGDNNLCRWLYDTFQSGVPDLQLLVLRFLPIIAGVYLSRISHRKPQAGFEAVLLALYAHETTARAGQAVTVTIPDLSHPSVYHESKSPNKNNATDLNLSVVSPSLEPHGTVRSTRRARIVGVALELFYSKISQMPIRPKIDFCEFCKLWAGQDGDMYKEVEIEAKNDDEGDTVNVNEDGEGVTVNEDEEKKKNDKKKKVEGRVPLPWELMQPVLRILGHCLMGPNNNKDMVLSDAASDACRCLFARAMHDVNPKAILATGSLLRLSKSVLRNKDDCDDSTELPKTEVITL